jgi:predicted naringenin-chalcone synthase
MMTPTAIASAPESESWRAAAARPLAGIAGIGVALPGRSRSQRELWDGFFAAHYDHRSRARAVWLHCGVQRRHGVIDPFEEDVRQWSTEARMRRFLSEAPPLAARAARDCLAEAALTPEAVDQLTVVTCTGYGTPGLDIRLAAELGVGASAQRTHIGHMGCYAALPGLASVADAAVARGKVGLLVCLELTSLHLQPPTDDLEQLVAHALFADAAVAVAVIPGGGEFEVIDVVARTDVEAAPLMRWDVTDHGFRMGLSPRVPDVLERHVEGAVDELLDAHGVRRDAVVAWAIHPGGPRIVDVVGDRLGLAAGQLEASRAVLRDYGNCSSPTVLLVLDRLRRTAALAAGDPVVAMAFGPGLTLYTMLLRVR